MYSANRRRGPPRRTALLLAGALTALGSACEISPIVVTPADLVQGQVLDPSGAPVAATDVRLYSLNKSALGTEFDLVYSNGAGAFELSFPRHQGPSPNYVVTAPTALGFPLYGFAIEPQIRIDLTSTVLYELIAASQAPVTSFTAVQLQSLLTRARALIADRIRRNLIQTNVSWEKLHKAYRNALAGNAGLIAEFQADALLNGHYAGGVPYGKLNTTPVTLSSVPKTAVASVAENQTLPMSIVALDYENDAIFYSWTTQRIFANCGAPNEVAAGPVTTPSVGGRTWDFSPGYDFTTWNIPNVTVKVTAIISDGGLEEIKPKIWCVSVSNIERPPKFLTQPTLTATEDQVWTYTPAGISQDLAPFDFSLVPGSFPAGMDMCININAYPAAPVWNWQAAPAGRPCTTPYQIRWSPNNCQALSPQAVQIQAIDAINAISYQTFSVIVTEVNTPPVVSSAAAPLTGTEAIAWSYQPLVTDPQANPAALPSISGSNPPPFTYSPGGAGCADGMTFTLATKPPSATIDAATGLISWTPRDNETGNQNFTVVVDDGHGGLATQSFTVVVLNTEQPPLYASSPAVVNVFLDTIPTSGPTANTFVYTITASDDDLADNNQAMLSLGVTGLPPGATLTPNGLVNGASWTLAWPFDDSKAPTSFTANFNLCDTNSTDRPVGVFAAPITLVAGPPHDHLCSPLSILFDAPKRNIMPVIGTNPPTTVVATTPYVYNMAASDGNVSPADTIHFQLLNAASVPPEPNPPAGMSITETSTSAPVATADLNWTPNNTTDLGFHTVKVRVYDGNAFPGQPHFSVQTISLFVQEHNTAPTIGSACPTTAQDGTQLVYNVAASDVDTTTPNNKLTYSLTSSLPGMTIDARTGKFTWNPSVAQALVGTASFTVSVADGGTTPTTAPATQTCPLTLTYVNLAPEIDALADQTIPQGSLFEQTITASDPDGDPLTLQVLGLPAGASFVDNGNGTGVFSWTPGTSGLQTLTVRAVDTYSGTLHHTTDVTWKVNAVNTPIFLSHPVLSANSNGNYLYEIHAIDPAGLGLNFEVQNPPPLMMTQKDPATGIWTIKWKPNTSSIGNNPITLRAIDGHGAVTTQMFTINVKTSANTVPTLVNTTPDYAVTSSVTEGKLTSFNVSSLDPDGDSLHYAWYWDGVWKDDLGATLSTIPKADDSGDHVLRVDITDGAVIQSISFNVHVRDAIPTVASSYAFGAGTFKLFALAPRAGTIVTVHGGGAPTYRIFNEATFASGATGTAALPFVPERITLRNDYGLATYFVAYLTQLGAIGSGGNQYVSVASDDLSVNPCTAGFCGPVAFDSAYPSVGGTDTAYDPTTQTKFNLNPGNSRYLSSATAGVANADLDLGATATGTSVAFAPAPDRLVFVTDKAHDRLYVVNAVTRTLASTRVLPAGGGPTAMYFNPLTRNLYIYNSVAGSISEYNVASAAVATTTGVGAAASLGANPVNFMTGDDVDGIVYIANPDAGTFVNFDPNYGTVRILAGQAAGGVARDKTNKRAFGASYSANKLLQLK